MNEAKRSKTGLALLLAVSCLVWAIPSAYADTDSLEVRYTGSEGERIVAGSELFAYVDNGLPGDVFMGSVNVVNESDDACEVFVHAQDVVADGPDDMLERIPFTLETVDGTVFEGVLGDSAVTEPISLGVLQAGEIASVNCKAVIPSELTSEYADAAVGMNVAVGMRAHEEANRVENPLVSTGASAQGAPLVQAGDMLIAIPFVLGVLAAAGTLIWCAWKRRMGIR